jgi:exopolyphosphatase/guanosine-5'-triphosphate,3'-diphosphate pyrophosphatase
MRVAAIDCGTNSIRLLVADVDSAGMHELRRDMQVVRLGQGVDATGRFADEAIARTFAACDEYAAVCRDLGVERVRFVATSATRDAANRDVFVAGVRDRLGVLPDVISGDEEATLSFAGATRELLGRQPSPFLVVDIGGGSTEFVLGEHAPQAARSVDIGCVRMTERHRFSGRPDPRLIDAAIADIDAAIARACEVVPVERAATFVAVAGSATTVAAMALHLPAYDREAIHGTVLTRDQVRGVSDAFLAMDSAQRAALPFMHPGRVDVIPAGALILRRIMEVCGIAEVRISEHDILDGIAWSIPTL